MLNIINYQENENQSHKEIPPHADQNDYRQNDNKQQVLTRMCRKRKPAGGNVNSCTLLKTAWRLLKRLKVELPHNPAIPFLGTFPRKTKTLIQKDNIHFNVHCSIIYNSQDTEAA